MNVEPRSKERTHYGYVAVPSSVTLPLRLFDLIQFHRADTHASGTTLGWRLISRRWLQTPGPSVPHDSRRPTDEV